MNVRGQVRIMGYIKDSDAFRVTMETPEERGQDALSLGDEAIGDHADACTCHDLTRYDRQRMLLL